MVKGYCYTEVGQQLMVIAMRKNDGLAFNKS